MDSNLRRDMTILVFAFGAILAVLLIAAGRARTGEAVVFEDTNYQRYEPPQYNYSPPPQSALQDIRRRPHVHLNSGGDDWGTTRVHTTNEIVGGTVSHGNWVYMAYEFFAVTETDFGHRIRVMRMASTGEIEDIVVINEAHGRIYGFEITAEGYFRFLLAGFDFSDDDMGETLVVAQYSRAGSLVSHHELEADFGDSMLSINTGIFTACGGLVLYTHGNIFTFAPDKSLTGILETDWGYMVMLPDGEGLFMADGFANATDTPGTFELSSSLREIDVSAGVWGRDIASKMVMRGINSSGFNSLDVRALFHAPVHTPFDMYVYLNSRLEEVPRGLYGFCLDTNEIRLVTAWNPQGISTWMMQSDHVAIFPDGSIAMIIMCRDTFQSSHVYIKTPPGLAPPDAEELPLADMPDVDPRIIHMTNEHLWDMTYINGWIYFGHTVWNAGYHVLVVERIRPDGTDYQYFELEWPRENWSNLNVDAIKYTADNNFLLFVTYTNHTLDRTTAQIVEFDTEGNFIRYHARERFEDMWFIDAAAFTDDGRVVFIGAGRGDSNERIYVLGPDDTVIGGLELTGWSQLYRGVQGRFFVLCEMLREFCPNAGQWVGTLVHDMFDLPLRDAPMRPGDRSIPFDVYYHSFVSGYGRTLFGYDAELDEWMRILSWEGVGLTTFNVLSGLDLADGRIAALYRLDVGTGIFNVIIVVEG